MPLGVQETSVLAAIIAETEIGVLLRETRSLCKFL